MVLYLPVPYVPLRILHTVRWLHISILMCFLDAAELPSQYRKTFILLSVSLWNDLAERDRGVRLAGFKRGQCVLFA